MQKIMDQSVNRNQLHANVEPGRANVSGANQNVGQGHGQDLVRNPVDVAQRLDQGIDPIWAGQFDCLTQSLINPSHQIAIGNVPNEQIQAIGHLVEMAVSQMMGRHRAGANVVRLAAGAAGFFVSTVMKMPIGLKLRASRPFGQISSDGGPGRSAVFGHIIRGNLVRDSLKAEIVHQPVEQGGGVVSCNRVAQSLVAKFSDQIKRTGKAANLVNQAKCIFDSSWIETDRFSR